MGVLAEGLTDAYGRSHTYLRLSITDRCNFRCTYCMPEEGLKWAPRSELLTFEEIERLVGIFVGLGITKVRLTGGEPTARAGLSQLVHRLARVPGLSQIAMTTNGHNLAQMAGPLAAAGLQRVNISIDSLNSQQFSRLTGGGKLDAVLRGVHAARLAGLQPIRLNTVILRNENEDEIMPLIRFVERHPESLEIRFIEYMPFQVRSHQTIASAELRERISQFRQLVPASPSGEAPGPAQRWHAPETGLRLGFIAPLSDKFCSSCNRLRLQATGQLRTCLAHEDTPSLRDLLRAGASDEGIAQAIRRMVQGKPEGHECTVQGGKAFEGFMTGIGG